MADNSAVLDSSILGEASTLETANADLSNAKGELADYTAQRDQLQSNFNPGAEAGPQPTFNQPTPEDHFQDVMKQAPFIMALGAMGGALGKQHGITMLASTNAMMKGVVQGNADQYKEAREKYDQQYQDFRDKSKTWLDVYKAYSVAYKGQIDAAQKAVTAANASVGQYEKAQNNSTKMVAMLVAARKQLEVSDAKIKAMSTDDVVKMLRAQSDQARVGIAQQNADSRSETAHASTTRASIATSKSKEKSAQAEADTEEVVNMGKDLENQLNTNTTLMTGRGSTLRRGAEFVGTATGITDNAPATKFKDDVALWRTKVTGLLKSKGKMGADERKVLNDALGVLDGATSREQALTAIRQVNKLLAGGFKQETPQTKTVGGKTYVQKDGKWYEQ